MAEIWNSWEVTPPPVCTIKMALNHKVISEVSAILYDALRTLSKTAVAYMDKEAAYLSRFLYKYKRAFRHDKGIQGLVKISQCLKRYLKLNLYDVINTYKQTLPAKPEPAATHAYLPPRQMLKWVLLRIQAFSKIFVRIIELAKETGRYIYGKMFLGWSLNANLLVFSIAARMLALSRYLVQKAIEWYNCLYIYLPQFELTAEFLPDYTFPVNLRKWLGDVDLSPPIQKSSIDEIFEAIDLIAVDDDDGDIKIESSFIKSFFKLEVSEVSSTREGISEAKKEFEENSAIKRSHTVEDLGVPVEDDKPNVTKMPRKNFERKNFLGSFRKGSFN